METPVKHPELRRSLVAAVATLATLLVPLTYSAGAHAQVRNLCGGRGYVVGFFNGVWNTPTQDGALAGLAALRDLIGRTYNNEPVEYELFYNHTGSTVSATFFQDLAETFIQRAREVDQTGALEQRYEYLWQVVADGDQSLWDRLTAAVPAAGGVLSALYTDFTTKAVAGYSLMLSSPPTAADMAEHRSRLDEMALQGQKLILVAHSQGNLFVNPAFDYINAKAGAGSVKVVHVAPASPTLRGSYTLADIDIVINGLRVQGLSSVPASNLVLPVSTRDLSGHKLVDTYLDGSRPGRVAVKGLVDAALGAAVTPAVRGAAGFFTVTLTWDGAGDVDLHAFEPAGAHVFYSTKAGASGFLDVDNTTANGPEHYTATCNADLLQTGLYQIGINNYSGATGRTATVQVASAQSGVLTTKRMSVGPVRGSGGNASPLPAVAVTVVKDTAGNYSASAQ
jgi:hypothetical protein